MAAQNKIVDFYDMPNAKALAYAASGFAILPLHKSSKTPILTDWQNRASSDIHTVRRWWDNNPTSNIGLHVGKSGLVVIDVDPRNGGKESMTHLESERGWLADEGCAIARTGGGGWHYVFTAPTGIRLPASLAPGVDLITGNHYIVVDPSVHPSGKQYRWERGFDLLAMKAPAVLPEEWWTPLGAEVPSSVDWSDALANLPPERLEDTPAERDRLKSALKFISADCEYPQWQRVVFAILASGLPDAVDIACEWSQTAPDRFDELAFTTLVDSYRDERRHGEPTISVASVFHLAERAGWKNPRKKSDEVDDLDISFRAVAAHEFAEAKPVSWLVRSLIQREGLGVIYGEPGSGKSFLVLDISGAVALGEAWRGLAVDKGPVVYIAAEGADGLRKRLQALALERGVDLKDMPIWVIADSPNLLRDQDRLVAHAIKEIGGAVLVVVDTLASVTPGGNENSGEDMGAAIARCKRLQTDTGAFIMLVHHSGKDSSRGARGWSGLKAAVDVELEVTRNGDDRAVRVTKQKEGEDGDLFPFRLKPVELKPDSDGNAVSSCVVEHMETMPEGARREPTGTVQKIVYQIVKTFGSCSVDALLTAVAEKMTHDPQKRDKRREHAQRAIDTLLSTKLLKKSGNEISLWATPSSVWTEQQDDLSAFEGESD